MVVKMDQHSLTANGAQSSVSVPVAMEGRAAEKLSGRTTESIVQAEFGNHKNPMTTGTYAEEVAKQFDVKEVKSDLDVMDPANFISQCMTGEDAHDLSEEQTPLEEYTASSMERALVRVKEQRSAKALSAEEEAAKIRETEESIREKSEEIAMDVRLMEQMSQVLAGSELPIRETTLGDLKKAMDMAGGVRAFGDVAIQYMVANETAVTPKSIQDSLYGSGTAMVGKPEASAEMTTDDVLLAQPDPSRQDGFDEVRPQIEERLQADGLPVSEKELDTARWLYQNELPVTPENISQVDTVNQLRELDTETLLERLVSEMEDGLRAESADLSHMSREEVGRLVEKLVQTDDATVRRAYPEDPATARRQLEEIRLTMTVAAAREMSKLGVTIDIGNLEEMVDTLRAYEQQAKESLLSEAMLEATDANREMLGGTLDAAETVLAAPVELLSYTFESRQTITFEALASEGRSLIAGYQALTSGEVAATADGATKPVQNDIFRKMEQVYEAVGTEVRSDLGDSIRKAFGHMDSLLDEMGLPQTPENERAVRILGYNRMEITEASIREMQTYDNRVNTLMDAMKPQVVKRMIEENINPLELSLSELEEQVGRIREEVNTEDIAFSRFLWKLDKQKDISAEERESMIGIYRLLDKIEKSDGAVIGQLVNEGRDLSLKNMLEATRTRKKGHIDAEVSEESGATERVSTKGTAIDAQILSAFTASEMPGLKAVLSPKAMAAFAGDVEQMTPEELMELCAEHGETDGEMAPYYEEMAEDVRRTMEELDAQTMTFLQELELPETIRNVISADDFIRQQMKDVRELWTEEESEDVVENFDDPEGLTAAYERIEKNHQDSIENQKESDDITVDGIKASARMAGHISFFRSIRRYQMYEVPIMTERGVLDCNVTIRSGEEKARGTVEITVDSDELGRLQATFKLAGNKVSGFVTAERQDSIEAYEQMLSGLEKDLGEIGFTTDGNRLLQGNRNSLHVGDAAEGATNQDLYRIAKCFLQSIRK
ncbi:MAG: DUF6240 domain-containing protein [Eubacterium sp.]|nr:DUF6240 domain-containing protein [Eubacterium sp.]